MKTWWGIRHLRWLYYAWQLDRHLTVWAQITGLRIPSQRDIDFLYAVWRGEM